MIKMFTYIARIKIQTLYIGIILGYFSLLPHLAMAVPAKEKSPVILEGRNQFSATVANGSADISVTVAFRVWILMGEPVVACAAKWELKSIRINSTTYWQAPEPNWAPNDLSQTYHIPQDVWKKVSINKAHALVTPKLYPNSTSFMCDLGVFGPPDNRSISYNTPGSPNWDRFLLDNRVGLISMKLNDRSTLKEIEHTHKHYSFDETTAKKLARTIKHYWKYGHESGTPLSFTTKLVDVDLNLYAVQQHLQSRSRELKSGKSMISNTNQSQAQSSVPTLPSTGISKRQTHNTSTSELPLEAALDELQRLTGSDSDTHALKPTLNPPVSQVTVPIESSIELASLSLLLLIDTSASMQGNRITEAKSAAKMVIDRTLQQGGEVAVLGFSGNCSNPIPQRHPFSRNAHSIGNFIESLTTNGGTPMSAAVEYANRYMALNRSDASNSEMILLLADGDDSCGIMSPVVKALKSDGILFRHQTVGLEIGTDSAAVQQLEQLANDSGGDYQHAANAEELGASLRRAAQAEDILEMLGRFGSSPEITPQFDDKPNQSSASQMQGILDGFKTKGR
ncbi:conserved hypothetical protein [Pseudomonas sp. 9AZ]|uniref:vWA domain-containing protein n=1 Tax=Pseudomonas sp. 9AZ TaxID=2653168 RepID=UPI0012F05C40|nr:vWA domain-containing protein [Pseudomonas sp. 9AZ]VXD00312.1 conserved hypothetical protein [Pseudomonas sp. 9AZ]